jgi:hypothetical protein
VAGGGSDEAASIVLWHSEPTRGREPGLRKLGRFKASMFWQEHRLLLRAAWTCSHMRPTVPRVVDEALLRSMVARHIATIPTLKMFATT